MYVLPTFNLTCAIYDYVGPGFPLFDPRLTSLCNLAFGRRVNVASTGGTGSPQLLSMAMSVLLPAATDVRAWPCYGDYEQGDIVEVPQGSGRYYICVAVDDVGKGFSNEHRCATCMASFDWGTWPTPIP